MGSVVLSGATSGATTLQPTDATTQTITFPSGTGTVITTQSTGKVIPTAALPAGTVLQVVQGTYTNEVSTSSASYVTLTLSASITPTSASSKILVIYESTVTNTSLSSDTYFTIYRNATNIGIGSGNALSKYVSTSVGYTVVPLSACILDTPSTTSSVTYTGYGRCIGGTAYFHSTPGGTITLMEIAA